MLLFEGGLVTPLAPGGCWKNAGVTGTSKPLCPELTPWTSSDLLFLPLLAPAPALQTRHWVSPDPPCLSPTLLENLGPN